MTVTRPCPEFETLLLDRAGGSLDAAEAARLEAHLAGCGACRNEAAALAAALSAARLPPPSEAEQRALDRAQVATLRHWRGAEGSRRNRSLLQGFSAGFAVAAAAAVLVIAPGAYRRAQQAGAVPGGAAGLPDEVATVVAATDSDPAAAWEPDLDAVWEDAALAVGDATGDEELDPAWSYADNFTTLTDE
jgi:anti-sigma factor RsiW